MHSEVETDCHREPPEISIVVPVYNDADGLKRCLNALCNQSLPGESYEVIVIEDGGPPQIRDACPRDIPEGLSLRSVRTEHLGPAHARNTGVRMSRGGIVAFTDSDCVPEADWLEKLREALVTNPAAAAIEGAVAPSGPPEILSRVIMSGAHGQFLTANIAYRRRVLEDVGGFDEAFPLPAGEDLDLAYRILDKGYEVVSEPNARVYHPLQKIGTLQYLRRISAERVLSEVYLKKKHPKRYARGFRGSLVASAGWNSLVLPLMDAFNFKERPGSLSQRITHVCRSWLGGLRTVLILVAYAGIVLGDSSRLRERLNASRSAGALRDGQSHGHRLEVDGLRRP